MRTLGSMVRLVVGFLIVAVGSTLFGLLCIPFIPWRPVRIKLANVYGKIVGRTIVAVAGVRPRITHRERLDGSMPAIYLMNHTSTLDAFLGIWLCPIGGCGVFKKEIARIPFFGQLLLLSGHLRLDRFNRDRAVEAMAEIARVVKRHRLGIWIMPEGTRSKDGRLQPFKKGFVHLAIATGLPVVPVLIHGAHRNWEKGTYRLTSMDMDIDVLEPVSTAGWTEETAGAHAEALHAIFAKHLRDDQRPLPAVTEPAAQPRAATA